MSKGALWAIKVAPATNSENSRLISVMVGAELTSDWVIPVMSVMNLGTCRLGLTNVCNSSIVSLAVNLTAPISIISSVFSDKPVVSRSNATHSRSPENLALVIQISNSLKCIETMIPQ